MALSVAATTLSPTPAAELQALQRTGGSADDTERPIVAQARGPFQLAFAAGSSDSMILPEIPKELAELADLAKITLRAGRVILPSPIALRIQAGVNCVGTRDTGTSEQDHMARFKDMATKRRFTLVSHMDAIPAWAKPSGSSVVGYRTLMLARDGSQGNKECDHFGEVWEVPIGINENGVVRFKFDHPRRALWIAWLLVTGRIKPAGDEHVQERRARKSHQLGDVMTTAYPTDHARQIATAVRERHLEAASAPILGVEPMATP